MPHRHGLHDRFMAWFMARAGGKYHAFVEGRKRDLLQDLVGTLVEIGSGTGPNLRYLPPGLRVVGVEPNPFMFGHYRQAAGEEGRSVELVQGLAESLPFPDDSVDAVLSTLVLCSVEGLGHVLTEIRRVLKPGGRFVFVEHVAAPEGTWLLRVQRAIRPLWRRIGDGCEPDRVIEADLRRAGFSEVSLDRFSVPLPIVSPHIAGFAKK